MYEILLTILYFSILVPAIIHLVRFRESASSRRLAAVFGVSGTLLAPTVALYLTTIIVAAFRVIVYIMLICIGLFLMARSLFR